MFFLSLRRASPSGSSPDTGRASKTSSSNTSGAAWPGSAFSGHTLPEPGSSKSLPALASLPETRQLVVQTALDHLFTQSHFSICQLDSVLKIINAPQGSDAYTLLRSLHCVDYAKMPRDLRDRIPHLVNECLRPPEVLECLATSVALQGVTV